MYVIQRISDGRFVMDLPAKYGRTYTRDIDYARRWRTHDSARAECFNAGREVVVSVADLERMRRG